MNKETWSERLHNSGVSEPGHLSSRLSSAACWDITEECRALLPSGSLLSSWLYPHPPCLQMLLPSWGLPGGYLWLREEVSEVPLINYKERHMWVRIGEFSTWGIPRNLAQSNLGFSFSSLGESLFQAVDTCWLPIRWTPGPSSSLAPAPDHHHAPVSATGALSPGKQLLRGGYLHFILQTCSTWMRKVWKLLCILWH